MGRRNCGLRIADCGLRNDKRMRIGNDKRILRLGTDGKRSILKPFIPQSAIRNPQSLFLYFSEITITPMRRVLRSPVIPSITLVAIEKCSRSFSMLPTSRCSQSSNLTT
jgi:hypothetical protein